MRASPIAIAAVLLCTFGTARADASGDASTLLDRYRAAWSKADPDAIGRLFAPRAEFIAASGDVFEGREQIAQVLGLQLHGPYAGSTLSTRIVRTSVIARGAVAMRGFWKASFNPHAGQVARTPDCGRYSAVLQESGGDWRILLFQESSVACKDAAL